MGGAYVVLIFSIADLGKNNFCVSGSYVHREKGVKHSRFHGGSCVT